MLSSLNTEQRAAAEHINGPLLVVAGAGSGKTRALTFRIANMIHQGIPYWQILAVTFTNKAAGEMKERIQVLLGQDEEKAEDLFGNTPKKEIPLIGTFHSIGVRILRTEFTSLGRDSNFSILDSDDSLAIVKRICKKFGIDDKKFNPRAIYSKISFSRNCFSTDEFFGSGNPFNDVVAQVYTEYEKRKKEMNAVDFDDLIILPVEIFQEHREVLEKYQNRWKYLSVDEFQDTNAVQLRFLELLSKEHKNICAIGDSDQSIYAFRGADISYIVNFGSLFPDSQIIKLEQNYRSTQNILDAADGVIKNNETRVPKKMWTDKGDGELVEIIDCRDEREEAEIIARTIQDLRSMDDRKYSDFAMLCRMNAQTRALEEACLRHGIPYQIIGGLKFYSRKEVRDVLAYLKFIVNPSDEASLLRIINLPPRKIGATTIMKLTAYGAERGKNLAEIVEHIDFAEGVTPAAKSAISNFIAKIYTLREKRTKITPAEMIEKVIDTFGLKAFYRDGSEEGEMRFENVMELKSVAHKCDGMEGEIALPTFLEEVALIADTDSMQSTDRVTIMTLHSSKGLEFPIVFIPGAEEGVLPHSRSMFEPESLEEERRLMYVGMTRAQEKLILLRADCRMAFGDYQYNPESRFLEEIPRDCLSRPAKEGAEDDMSYSSIEDEPMMMIDLSPGDRVRHMIFGEGEIIEMNGGIANINFDTAGPKKLSLAVAPLEKV